MPSNPNFAESQPHNELRLTKETTLYVLGRGYAYSLRKAPILAAQIAPPYEAGQNADTLTGLKLVSHGGLHGTSTRVRHRFLSASECS
jgi:hypothetical protein